MCTCNSTSHMTKPPWNQYLITVILLLASIAVSKLIYAFLVNEIPLFLNRCHFLSRTTSGVLSLFILKAFHLSFLSFIQQMTDVHSKISSLTRIFLQSSHKLHITTLNYTTLLSRWYSSWMTICLGLHVTLVLACMTPSPWKVPMLLTNKCLSSFLSF